MKAKPIGTPVVTWQELTRDLNAIVQATDDPQKLERISDAAYAIYTAGRARRDLLRSLRGQP